ncbi:TetR/AcrR family transcriptional regulator [Pedococcus sp. 5OH_020]|uniref:TetR/AcrR family transcriptional regulator n=1 Tax=Pedococcus sp. 5OH_020 TaxID=2989814 RepID=UPI0022E9D35C|nr:helix-turn-helix domain-containing protein [Pedococcus sp. 5OH_020]
MRRRRVDLERRNELLSALEDMLLSEGFRALTMDDMARRLHCSTATLYSVATSKEQLVMALTKDFFRQATEEIETSVAAVEDPPADLYLPGRRGVGHEPLFADLLQRHGRVRAHGRDLRRQLDGGGAPRA